MRLSAWSVQAGGQAVSLDGLLVERLSALLALTGWWRGRVLGRLADGDAIGCQLG